MRLVIEMSKAQQSEADKMAAEEEEMIRLAIEASQREEEERAKVQAKEQENTVLAKKASEATAKQEQLKSMQQAAEQM